MYTLIVPLTKSPQPHAGRIGTKRQQDWYRCCEKAAELALAEECSKIVIISNFRARNCPSDGGTYYSTLVKLRVPRHKLIHLKEESETVGQVERAVAFAQEKGTNLLFISSLLHWPRVWWLTRNLNVKRKITRGIPRPTEAVTDIILAFVFPLVDLAGLRRVFQRITRRGVSAP